MGEIKLSFTDKIFKATVLKFIPRFVTPNALTIFRFATIPFVAYLFATNQFLPGAILFFISAFSDALDGALARTRNMVTEWGTVNDPFADKLLIGTAVLILIVVHLSVWLAFAIVFVELFIALTAIYERRVKHKILQPHWTGKLKMFMQSAGVIIFLSSTIFGIAGGLFISEIIFTISLGLALISLIIYESA